MFALMLKQLRFPVLLKMCDSHNVLIYLIVLSTVCSYIGNVQSCIKEYASVASIQRSLLLYRYLALLSLQACLLVWKYLLLF